MNLLIDCIMLSILALILNQMNNMFHEHNRVYNHMMATQNKIWVK